MNTVLAKTCARIGLVVLAWITLMVPPTGGQERASSPTKTMVQEIGWPRVDRGLPDSVPARPPRTVGHGVWSSSADGSNVGGGRPCVDGSVIVKFRTGAAGEAVNSALRVAQAT